MWFVVHGALFVGARGGAMNAKWEMKGEKCKVVG
jgi:hypothetical protein